ncbi:MAG: hypothetical protein IPK80_29680 [Nannocystis sp.]|nr:hypothetical protein [Nannocystis sp.]
MTADSEHIGHLPDYLLEEVQPLIDVPDGLQVIVERLNPPPIPSQQRVLCRLRARWSADFRPFSGPKYASLVDHAAAHERDAEAARAE